jgi:hypothetical protein
VITQVEGSDGQLRIIQLEDQVDVQPDARREGDHGNLRRLTLHLSIGEAY